MISRARAPVRHLRAARPGRSAQRDSSRAASGWRSRASKAARSRARLRRPSRPPRALSTPCETSLSTRRNQRDRPRRAWRPPSRFQSRRQQQGREAAPLSPQRACFIADAKLAAISSSGGGGRSRFGAPRAYRTCRARQGSWRMRRPRPPWLSPRQAGLWSHRSCAARSRPHAGPRRGSRTMRVPCLHAAAITARTLRA